MRYADSRAAVRAVTARVTAMNGDAAELSRSLRDIADDARLAFALQDLAGVLDGLDHLRGTLAGIREQARALPESRKLAEEEGK